MKNIRKIKIILVISILIGMCMSTKSQAGLQANKGGATLDNQTPDTFYTKIREMESKTGTLAVDADSDDSKNGIDCHMVKSTEWGTAALMATSIFGTIPEKRTDNSTTGNESGIYQMANSRREWTTGFLTGNPNGNYSIIYNAEDKYKTIYTESKAEHSGDGLEFGNNENFSSDNRVLSRGIKSLFNFGGSDWNGSDTSGYVSNSKITSRAVVVCGANF